MPTQDRCPNCDKPCATQRQLTTMADDDPAADALCWSRYGTHCPSVDWRSRALAAEASLAAATREADRLRHDVGVEGDFVTPDSLRADAAEARVAVLEAAIRPLVKWDTPHHEDCPRGQCFDCDCDEECFAGGDCCCQTHQCAGVGECPAAESAALRALLAGAKEPGDGR